MEHRRRPQDEITGRRGFYTPDSTLNRGFTLVEVLVTTLLVAIAVVGVFGGIRSIAAADAKARTVDLLQRLAAEKMADIRVLDDPGETSGAGDFSDRGDGDISWTATVEQSGADNVDQVTVTTRRGGESQSLTTLMFVAPQTGSAFGAAGGESP